MKRHGNYQLPSPDDLLLDCGVDGCKQEYIALQLQRLKRKYKNDKRHKAKQKSRYNKIRFNKNGK